MSGNNVYMEQTKMSASGSVGVLYHQNLRYHKWLPTFVPGSTQTAFLSSMARSMLLKFELNITYIYQNEFNKHCNILIPIIFSGIKKQILFFCSCSMSIMGDRGALLIIDTERSKKTEQPPSWALHCAGGKRECFTESTTNQEVTHVTSADNTSLSLYFLDRPPPPSLACHRNIWWTALMQHNNTS